MGSAFAGSVLAFFAPNTMLFATFVFLVSAGGEACPYLCLLGGRTRVGEYLGRVAMPLFGALLLVQVRVVGKLRVHHIRR